MNEDLNCFIMFLMLWFVVFVLIGGAGFPRLTADLTQSRWYQTGKQILQWIKFLLFDSWSLMPCVFFFAAVWTHQCTVRVWPVCQSRRRRSQCCCRHQTTAMTSTPACQPLQRPPRTTWLVAAPAGAHFPVWCGVFMKPAAGNTVNNISRNNKVALMTSFRISHQNWILKSRRLWKQILYLLMSCR